MPGGLLWIAVLTLLALPGQAEQPVGLVLEAQGGELLRAGTFIAPGCKSRGRSFRGRFLADAKRQTYSPALLSH